MAMQAVTVIDRVRTMTGDVNKAQFSDFEIINWINDAQHRLIARTEVNQEHFVIQSIADQRNYYIPSPGTEAGFTKIRDCHVNGIYVAPTTLEEINQAYPDMNSTISYPSGQPQYFWVDTAQHVGYNLQLFPAPAESGWNIEGLKIAYPNLITAISSDLSIYDWQLETLTLMCLQRAKEWEGDTEGAMYFDRLVDKRLGEDSYNHAVRQMESYPNIRQLASDVW